MPRRPVNAAYLKKDPSAQHEGFSAYIAKTTGHEVPIGDVSLVLRLYPKYLKSDDVVKAKEAAARARQEAAEAKAKEKRERAQKRLDALEEQRQRLLAELGIEDEQESKDGDDEPNPVVRLRSVPDTDERDNEDDGPAEILVLGDSDVVDEDDEDEDDLWDDDEDEDDF